MDIIPVINKINDIDNKRDRIISYVNTINHLENLNRGIGFQPTDDYLIDYINTELNNDIHEELNKQINLVNKWLDFELEK